MAKSRRAARSAQRYVQCHEYLMRSPGWRRLSSLGKCAWLEFGLVYNGGNNGRLGVSARWLAERLDISPTAAAKAIRDLVNCGFVDVVKSSDFGKKKCAAEYRLTHLPCDATGAMPSKKFLRDIVSNHREILEAAE